MDPNHSAESPLAKIQQHRGLFITGGLLLFGISVVGTMVLSGGAVQPEIAVQTPEEPAAAEVTSTPQPTVVMSPAEQKKLHMRDVVNVVAAVLVATRDGQLEQATPYFLYGVDYWGSKDSVVAAVLLDKQQFSENGVYDGVIDTDRIEILDRKAQVPVKHVVGGRTVTSRYDLRLVPDGWRIAFINRQQPDLMVVATLAKEQQEEMKTVTFSAEPIIFILPGGDVVELKKTLFTSLRTPEGRHEDVEMRVQSAKNDYVTVFYSGSHIVYAERIMVDNQGTYFHANDIRPLVNAGGGSILFYPPGTVIDTSKLGKPPGALYEIPIKVDIQ